MNNQHFSTFEDIEQYRQSDAINQSLLKACYTYSGYVKASSYQELSYKEQASHNKIGSAVDIALTMKPEDYENTFYISTIEKYPSDNMLAVARYVHEKASLIPELLTKPYDPENYSNIIDEACTTLSYLKNYGTEKRVEKVITETSEFFNELVSSNSKVILSYAEAMVADNLIERFRNSELTNRFVSGSPNVSSHTEIYYQFPITWEMKDVECKALIDILLINNSNGTATPIDIKTMEDDSALFQNSFYKFGYNVQAAFYKHGLKEYFKKTDSNIHINDFTFFVGSKSNNESAIRGFEVSLDTHYDSLYGREESHIFATTSVLRNPVKIKYPKKIGIYQLLDNYKYFSSKGDFEKEIEVL